MIVQERINEDITENELKLFNECGYVCVDTETTGLNYKENNLCTIQLFCTKCSVLIRFDKNQNYYNLKELMLDKKIMKIFHNAVFDVSFLMNNLCLDRFGKIVCTKIASKLVNGIDHNNSLKPLLKEYLNVEITKDQQLSDWNQRKLTVEQKEYAMNDVRFLKQLWEKLSSELKNIQKYDLALECFQFIPDYKLILDNGITNIFTY